VSNADITRLFSRYVTLLEIDGANVFRVRAYQNAARSIDGLGRAAAERRCFLEVNAQPKRRDLADAYCKMAKDIGVKVAVSTDAHSTAQLGHMRLGVIQARRGWLGSDDVLNTRGLAALRKLLKRT
jgi:DNA polymerase (family 10)